jgi:hypothetical protein
MKECRYFRSESYRIQGGGRSGSPVHVVREWCTHPSSPKPSKDLIGELTCHGNESECSIPLLVVTRGSKVLTPWISGQSGDDPE